MTLTQIQYFLEVCSTMNFTKAAQNLYVAQPSLSRQIQLLETELGVQLLYRSNRSVVLTEAGQIFKKEFGRIEQNIQLALRKVQEAGQAKKSISIGLFMGVAPRWISDLIGRLYDFFSDYKIYVNKLNSMELKRAYEIGEIDLVISIEETGVRNEDVHCCKIMDMPACLVFSSELFGNADCSVTAKDFAGKRFVHIGDADADKLIDYQIGILKSLGLDNCDRIRADNVVGTLLYTEGKTGFSIYPSTHSALQAGITSEGLRSLPIPEITFPLSAYWNREATIPFDFFFSEKYPNAIRDNK